MGTKNSKRSCLKIVLICGAALLGLCLGLALVSALVNAGLPERSTEIEQLSGAEKARIREAIHLRQTFGDQVVPGLAQADIPIILFNEEYAFLTGLDEPADGWWKVPNGPQRGGAWEPVQGDSFDGAQYYRQPLPGPGISPENFTVKVGERWAAAFNTLEWMRIGLANQFRSDLPGAVQVVFPYGMVVDLFLDGSDLYVPALLHESTHAYQGMRAAERIEQAELSSIQHGKTYPWEDDALQEAWRAELETLRDGARAAADGDAEEARRLARRFIQMRSDRRQAHKLSARHIDLERQREWEEGIAKYAELSFYRLAAETDGYTPVPELALDSNFNSYSAFNRRWTNEINQIVRSVNSDDIRFYYSGMAQALLLDRLSPGWKERLFEPGVWLEDLLSEAAGPTSY